MQPRRRRTPRRLATPVALGALAALAACVSHRTPADATIPPGHYATAFQAAKDALRELHFDLDRVDAAGGIITTLARSSSGIATPWIDHDAPVEGLLHRDRRRATISFSPLDDEAPSVDRRTHDGPLTVDVTVEVLRAYVPGRRADATSIRLTSRAIDPVLVRAGLQPLAVGPVGRDEDLAARLARRVLGDQPKR